LDSYIDVRGNRYSVPGELVGQTVLVRIGLDDLLRVYHHDLLVASHTLQMAQQGWVTVPEHTFGCGRPRSRFISALGRV